MKPKIAFICVHNTCCSQIDETLGKNYANDILEGYSARTETKPKINQDAVRFMKDIYNIDMEQSRYSKLLYDIPEVAIVITIECNVDCPTFSCKYREDWGLEDPTGESDEKFIKIINKIEQKVLELRLRCNTTYLVYSSFKSFFVIY